MRPLTLAVAAVLLLAGTGLALAQTGSPFAMPGGGGSSAPASEPGVFEAFTAWIAAAQGRLHRDLAEAVAALRADPWSAPALTLMGLSFLYGVVHAAGPGHGKAVISAYLLATGEGLRRGIALSAAAAVVQALSAILLVVAVALAVGITQSRIGALSGWLERASYLLIALIGLWLAVRAARALLATLGVSRGAAHSHAHHHDHHHHEHVHGEDCSHGAACGHAHAVTPEMALAARRLRDMAAVAVSVGLRPCTGAILVLVFAWANGILSIGIAATFAMAAGTAATVALIAALSVGARSAALRLFSGRGVLLGLAAGGIGLAAGLFVAAAGISLFLAPPAGPGFIGPAA
ncbi:nickel/cobalt transporter [Futiania mangrovi]|uniref:Nickel/cobalt efflux system n=1 Tax=Futiania mangrovi TaxID=2959716 RepID=A0A9J6PGA8_9PROT|nr:hypothetical protein [Futiania mangrovii]MCP1336856.1 hypothetical protein [Futiania mangrovii]